jgi:hypothetical protein
MKMNPTGTLIILSYACIYSQFSLSWTQSERPVSYPTPPEAYSGLPTGFKFVSLAGPPC